MSYSRTLNTYFALWAVCVIASVLTPLFLIPFNVIGYVVGCVLVVIASVIFQYLLLYQGWKSIPSDIARTTPGKAIGFLFIPIFNFYWMFIAYNGLGKDMNKTMQQRGIQFHVNENLGLRYCVWVLIFSVTSCVPDICTLISRILPEKNLDVLFSIGFIAQITMAVAGLISIFALIGFLRTIKNGAIALTESNISQEPQV